MANLCSYSMRVKGNRDSVCRFYNRMINSDMPNHLCGIYEADINKLPENKDGTITIEIVGACAWSIENCRTKEEGIDLLAVNSKELNLIIEIWSDECGIGFQEHFLYKKGKCLCSKCIPWNEYFYNTDEFRSFEEFKEAYLLPDNISEKDLDENNCYYTGGFDNYCEFSI